MNSITQLIAKAFREVYFGKNWTYSNLKDQLEDVSWEEATTKVESYNTIATLVHHSHYYVPAVIEVLKGGQLNAKDELSFEHPPIQSEEDWQTFLEKAWKEANEFADLVEKLPDNILYEDFAGGEYGNYYRNLHGIIEHTHYHLGQIAIIKKKIKTS